MNFSPSRYEQGFSRDRMAMKKDELCTDLQRRPLENLLSVAPYGLALTVAILVPRLNWLLVFLIGGPSILIGLKRCKDFREILLPSVPALALIAVAIWACVTSFWSVESLVGIGDGLTLAGLALFASAAVKGLPFWTRGERSSFGRALVLAAAICGSLILFESYSGQYLTIHILQAAPWLSLANPKHMQVSADGVVTIDVDEINRRTAVLTLLFLPTLLAAYYWVGSKMRNALCLVLAAAFAALLYNTDHQASQLAVAAAAAVYLFISLNVKIARTLVMIGWTVAVLFLPPLVSLANKGEMQNAAWLPYSAKVRLIIWQYGSSEIAKRPILGVGAGATGEIDKERPAQSMEVERGNIFPSRIPWHMHNFYIQLMYETGLVGSLLFLLFGFAAQRAIWQSGADIERFVLPYFAGAASLISCSWALWQFWLHAAIALGLIQLLFYAPRDASEPVAVKI